MYTFYNAVFDLIAIVGSLFPPLSTELRKQAAQFKALALAETVGHTLAEEALHEAEERAASCEVAEAVLIGSAAGGERRAAEEKEEGGAGI